jgi:hypothetical protein
VFKLPVKFEEILSRDHGNSEYQNEVLGPFIIIVTYYIMMIIITVHFNYIVTLITSYCNFYVSNNGFIKE